MKISNSVPPEGMHELLKDVITFYTLKNGVVVMSSTMGVASSGDSNEAVRQTDSLFNEMKLIEKNLLIDVK